MLLRVEHERHAEGRLVLGDDGEAGAIHRDRALDHAVAGGVRPGPVAGDNGGPPRPPWARGGPTPFPAMESPSAVPSSTFSQAMTRRPRSASRTAPTSSMMPVNMVELGYREQGTGNKGGYA